MGKWMLIGLCVAITGCSSGSDGNGTGTGGDGGGAGGDGGESADSGGGGSTDSGVTTDGGAGGGFTGAEWIGTWSCTSSGTLNGSMLPNTASTAVITKTGPNQLKVVSTSTSPNPPCTLTATLTSESGAALPMGQACKLTTPVAATLTLTPNSTAKIDGGKLATTENVVVSMSPGFDGQMGTLTSSCTKM
jgi:hypothetical protein